MISIVDEYEAFSKRQEEAARSAMGQFLRTLPDAKRRELLGVKPPSDRPKQVGLDDDVANSPAASYSPDLMAEMDDIAEELQEQFRFLNRADAGALGLCIDRMVREESERYNTWLLTRVTARLIEAGNVKIAAVSVAFAISMPMVWVNGELCKTQRQAAKKLGCSVSNLSKETRHSADFLGISEGIHLKPPSAVEAFRLSQMMKHWRKQFYGAE